MADVDRVTGLTRVRKLAERVIPSRGDGEGPRKRSFAFAKQDPSFVSVRLAFCGSGNCNCELPRGLRRSG
jgi:hypothetical protein